MLNNKTIFDYEKLWLELRIHIWEEKTDKETDLNKYHHSCTEPWDEGFEIGSLAAVNDLFDKMNELEGK